MLKQNMAAKYSSGSVAVAMHSSRQGTTTSSAPYPMALYTSRSPSDVSISAGTGNLRQQHDNNGAISTSAMADHMRRQNKRSKSPPDCGDNACVRCLFHRYDFRRADTERLYSAYAFRSRFVDIRALGILLTALFLSLAVVDFVCAARPTIDSVTNVGLGATTSVLLVVLHTRLVTRRRLPLVAGAVVCICLVFAAASMLPVSRRTSRALPAEGVWRLCYVVFAVGVLVPLPLYIAIGVAVIICSAHGAVAALTAVEGHPGLVSRQVSETEVVEHRRARDVRPCV
jgi:hypothetical protein